MAHQSFKLLPGVDQNKTPTLNEAAISVSQLIRFIPDRTLGGLVQKLGGWTKYFNTAIGSIVRALWAWEDTNNHSYLAVGSQGGLGLSSRSLQVISSNSLRDITPRKLTVNVAVNASTDDTATPPDNYAVLITDSGRNISNYDVVDIQTQISVGGIVLFGLYQCYNPGGSVNTYTVYAANAATSTVTNGGQVPIFTTTAGSAVVNVTLADHGFIVGDTFPILVATTVSTITLYGNYKVNNVLSSSNFEIGAANTAAAADTVYENGGQAHFVYYKGVGPLALGTGYGIGPYGDGGYGTGIAPTLSTGIPINAVDWTLDNWGETLIACPLDGPIYSWTPNDGNTVASIIPEAPSVNEGIFVAMPQRQIIAWGSTFNGIKDPLLIRWCDVENYNDWILSPTNQAGSYRIPKGSRIVQCIQGPQQGLIWTDLGCWAMQYVGPPYVYQFNEIGTGCGLIGRKAAGSVNGVVYWMGPSQFYRLSGSGVEPIRCPVWDVVFQDLDRDNLDSIRIAPNSRFGEIAWHYPTISTRSITNIVVEGSFATVTFSGPGIYVIGKSIGIFGVTPLVYNGVYDVTASSSNSVTFFSGSSLPPYVGGGEITGSVENNAYVKYNFVLDQWDYGSNSDANPYVARTAWINESVLGPPIGAGSDQYLYQHETSQNADGSPLVSYFQTGYFVLTEADMLMFIDQVWPDMKWGYFGGTQGADVLLTFYVTSYPNEEPIAYGPYTLTQATTYITPRFRGRLVSIRIESNDIDSWWRLGNIRYRIQQDGRFL